VRSREVVSGVGFDYDSTEGLLCRERRAVANSLLWGCGEVLVAALRDEKVEKVRRYSGVALEEKSVVR
jgi:hypothetical protein